MSIDIVNWHGPMATCDSFQCPLGGMKYRSDLLFRVASTCPPVPPFCFCWPTLDLPAGNTMLQYILRPICA